MNERGDQCEVLRSMLERFRTVHVAIDSRDDKAVVLPRHLQRQEMVTLELGYDLPIQIPDLVVHEGGFRATLSFAGQGCFECTVLWSAVYGMYSEYNGQVLGRVFREDWTQISAKHRRAPAQPIVAPRARKVPNGWRVIEGGGQAARPPKGAA